MFVGSKLYRWREKQIILVDWQGRSLCRYPLAHISCKMYVHIFYLFSALCNGRKCVENAYCYKDTCQCNDGFHGNGYIKCESKYIKPLM